MDGKAIIFSAPSGAGKTTIVQALVEKFPQLRFSISLTTREKRSFETPGKDYYFTDNKSFLDTAQKGELIEWEEVYQDVYYGTLKSEVERIWQEKKVVIFDVDVKGGLTIKKALKENAISIFIKVKSSEVLRARLQARNTESDETLERRVQKSLSEMQYEDQFDHIVLNDNLGIAIEDAESIVKDFLEQK